MEESSDQSHEKRLARRIAEGFGAKGYLAEISTASGLLGGDMARTIDLASFEGSSVVFYDFRVTATVEDICKGLRQLIVHSSLYQAFLENPRTFGYNTEKSPLLAQEPDLGWELVVPADMLNPRRVEQDWSCATACAEHTRTSSRNSSWRPRIRPLPGESPSS